jgi:hypothetical protein
MILASETLAPFGGFGIAQTVRATESAAARLGSRLVGGGVLVIADLLADGLDFGKGALDLRDEDAEVFPLFSNLGNGLLKSRAFAPGIAGHDRRLRQAARQRSWPRTVRGST